VANDKRERERGIVVKIKPNNTQRDAKRTFTMPNDIMKRGKIGLGGGVLQYMRP
jgi:hypothetical protein